MKMFCTHFTLSLQVPEERCISFFFMHNIRKPFVHAQERKIHFIAQYNRKIRNTSFLFVQVSNKLQQNPSKIILFFVKLSLMLAKIQLVRHLPNLTPLFSNRGLYIYDCPTNIQNCVQLQVLFKKIVKYFLQRIF